MIVPIVGALPMIGLHPGLSQAEAMLLICEMAGFSWGQPPRPETPVDAMLEAHLPMVEAVVVRARGERGKAHKYEGAHQQTGQDAFGPGFQYSILQVTAGNPALNVLEISHPRVVGVHWIGPTGAANVKAQGRLPRGFRITNRNTRAYGTGFRNF